MVKRLVSFVLAAGAVVALSSSAFALDCHNISRNVSASEQTFATTSQPFLSFPIGVDPASHQPVFWNVMPLFKGNWYLLALTEGAPEPVGTTIDIWWGFIPPGTVPGVPGSNGNYTNGKVDDLLGMAACPVARQDIHGIQSGACGFTGP
jgi:hypothetical protein